MSPWRSSKQLRSEGEARRKACPRARLAEWKPSLRQRKPADLLVTASKGRLPDLLKLKRQRMAASPFGFFRGAVPVMAYDLSLLPNSGILTQLCGDAHVQNLGAFCGLDGRLVFDINDFDESLRGPFDFDVRRMAASILLAGASARLKRNPQLAAARLFIDSYRGMMQRFARMPILEVARFQVHRLAAVQPISKILAQAERQTPALSLKRLTHKSPHGRSFNAEPPLLRPLVGSEAQRVLASLHKYAESLLPERKHFLAQYKPIAVAFKVVGTGSVGLRDYCVYLEGNDNPEGNDAQDPLFLQIKEEARSAWAPYLPGEDKKSEHQGQRVVQAQRAMQLQSDPMLGWTRIQNRDYLVRQLNDHKASVDMTKLKAAALSEYATVCGELLARGHARSGDARVIAGYIGPGTHFADAIVNFASAYAEQTVADWKQMIGPRRTQD